LHKKLETEKRASRSVNFDMSCHKLRDEKLTQKKEYEGFLMGYVARDYLDIEKNECGKEHH